MKIGFRLCMVALLFTSTVQATSFVFTDKEPVTFSAPAGTQSWKLLLDDFSLFSEGTVENEQLSWEPGTLPVGWYKLDFFDESGTLLHWTSIAILTALKESPSPDTPIAVDVALSWVPPAGEESWTYVSRLAALAGVRMVRDRLHWRELQPEPGHYVAHSKYDDTAAIQQATGLEIMQVFHHIPLWLRSHPRERNRIPRDLRMTWRFCRDAAERFQDTVQFWQPWNEGNASNFGAHTTDELASHQKAAYFGFKEGNPEATVCWGPYAGIFSENHYDGMVHNRVGAYFDIFSFHSYDWNHDYPRLRPWAFKATGGKPMWVSESDRGMLADPESAEGDFTWPYEKLKASFIIQSAVSSLASGADKQFHFVLPWYMERENTIQFGLLRKDGSPRMGYAALAALGHLLADGKYQGQWVDEEDESLYLFAFQAKPQGEKKEVLVVWSEGPNEWRHRGTTRSSLSLPAELTVESAWDYLGRPLPAEVPEEVGGTPVFLVLPVGSCEALKLHKPVVREAVDFGEPCPIIFQFSAPVEDIQMRMVDWSTEHDRTARIGEQQWELAVYNLTDERVTGQVNLTEIPAGWTFKESSWTVSLEAMERRALPLVVHIDEDALPLQDTPFWLVVRGDFEEGMESHLGVSFRPPKVEEEEAES